MAKNRKSLGFTELRWVCPYCDGVNRGTVRVCGNCSAPQSADVEFVQPSQERVIADETRRNEIQSKSADIHCAYCGTRNDASNKTCARCLADLSEGTTRSKGHVIGAHRDKARPDVACPSCGTANQADRSVCASCHASLRPALGIAAAPAAASKPRPSGGRRVNAWVPAALFGVFILIVITMIVLANRTTEVVGRVQAVEWQRSIPILALGPVEYDTWWDRVPQEGQILQCEDRVRTTSPNPDPERLSLEVCGTPYTIDQGNGFGEIVQDCQYEVYDDWCEYVVEEWKQVDIVTAQGDSFAVYWPEVPNSAEFRSGNRSEEYQIQFRTDGDTHVYSTSSFPEFEAVQSIDNWILDVNTFGSIVSIEPSP